jgi:phosphodiesterase/alkaline phosphatase D-like protein
MMMMGSCDDDDSQDFCKMEQTVVTTTDDGTPRWRGAAAERDQLLNQRRNQIRNYISTIATVHLCHQHE